MKAVPDTADLQLICGLYRDATGRSEARISDLACSNPHLFKRLRANKGCTIATYNRVLAWFSEHWPAGVQWPSEIPRPLPAEYRGCRRNGPAAAEEPAVAREEKTESFRRWE